MTRVTTSQGPRKRTLNPSLNWTDEIVRGIEDYLEIPIRVSRTKINLLRFMGTGELAIAGWLQNLPDAIEWPRLYSNPKYRFWKNHKEAVK